MSPDSREPQGLDWQLHQAAVSAPEGDLRAFEQLVAQHHRGILANCRLITRDPLNAEDLAQEVFVKAYFGLRGFQGQSSVRHWLQRIKVNHCLNHLKKKEGKTFLSIDDATETPTIATQPEAHRDLEQMADRQRISAILDSMPATLRVPLIMSDMDDLSYHDIAATLGIGLSAVKMRIKRAREHFRRCYQPPSAA